MKKNTVRWWIVLAVVLVVYRVLVWALPFAKTGVYYLSWAFTLIAIAAQGYAIYTAFYQGEGVKSKFYGFPIARIGAVYLAAQLALGLAFMAMSSAVPVSLWIPLVVYVAMLGAAVLGFVAADAARDEVERQDAQLKKDVACMRTLQAKAAAMLPLAQDDQVGAALEKFAEDLRFSDPVSSDALADVEADLTACVEELGQAVTDGDRQAVLALTQKAESILTERNRLCKLGKQAAR